MQKQIYVNIVDIRKRNIYPAFLSIAAGKIKAIYPDHGAQVSEENPYVLPGFIDAHVHIESSMLLPSEFARMAVIHGTVATVSDPHEIANVLGEKGVEFMIENGKNVPFHFFFGAPSCVPATSFESAGASLDAKAVERLLKRDEILYLSEMMNFPGVLNQDKEVMKKITAAKKLWKQVDGHAPGLRGQDAANYAAAGITSDHECFTIEEAREKISLGMKIIIREGSAAKNFDELIPLIQNRPDMIMFCSDDKHPDSLQAGHINVLVKRAMEKKYDLFNILQAACINPVEHYKLPVGTLNVGDSADFIVVDNLRDFNIVSTFIKGKEVADLGKSLIPSVNSEIINNFNCDEINASDLKFKASYDSLNVIEAIDEQLITKRITVPVSSGNLIESDIENDILKIVVINRYKKASPAISFIKNFNLKKGAIASSVAHDSHNIIAVGTNDQDIAEAVNMLIREQGGVSAFSTDENMILPLPVAGLMSDRDAWEVSAEYTKIDKMAKRFGSTLSAPFMTLSFMALLVIPELKLSDLGLFDGRTFSFIKQ